MHFMAMLLKSDVEPNLLIRSKVLPTASSLKSPGTTPGLKRRSRARLSKLLGNIYNMHSAKPNPLIINAFIISEWLSLQLRVLGINSSITSEMPKKSIIAATI